MPGNPYTREVLARFDPEEGVHTAAIGQKIKKKRPILLRKKERDSHTKEHI